MIKHSIHSIPSKFFVTLTELMIKIGLPSKVKLFYQWHIDLGENHDDAILLTTRSVFNILRPDASVVAKHNQAYYLLKDAEFMLLMCKRRRMFRRSVSENHFARSAILLYPVALEALINSVYEYCESPCAERLSYMPLSKKWLDAPKNCLPFCGLLSDEESEELKKGKSLPSFDEKSDLFRSYVELKNIRNHIVHLKSTFNVIKAKDIKRYTGITGCYPLTGISFDIGQWGYADACKAKEVSYRMISELNGLLRGHVTELLGGPLLVEWVL